MQSGYLSISPTPFFALANIQSHMLPTPHARTHGMHQVMKESTRSPEIIARLPSTRPTAKRDLLDPLPSRLPSHNSHYPRVRSRLHGHC